MQEGALLLLAIKQKPLSLVLDVGEVGQHYGVPLMGSEGLLVEHVQSAPSLVIASSLSFPGFISFNRVELSGLI